MDVINLQKYNDGSVEFGYYITNNTIYFGVYTAQYSGMTFCHEIQTTDMFTLASYYNSPNKPSGWTTVATKFTCLYPPDISSSTPSYQSTWYNIGTRV